MSANTLARGLATVTDARPCARWDARMWETGNKGNWDAAEMCEWCPFKDRCPSDNPTPRGVIVAGIAYDDYGRQVPLGDPPVPVEPDPARPRRTAEYHDEIMRRHDAGDSWTKISIALRLSRYAVRGYGQRQLAARKRRVAA